MVTDPLRIALIFAGILEACHLRYLVGGSLASAVSGEPRSTVDIDLVLELAEKGVSTPEDILLQKLRWYRMGNEVSDRQWRDIMGIIRVQKDRLDGIYLKDGAEVLGVSDLLQRALEARR